MKKPGIRSYLSLVILLIVLLTVALTSLGTNILIEKRFQVYKQEQIDGAIVNLQENLAKQYNPREDQWNVTMVEAIGMHAMHEGFIVSVLDGKGHILWDAESCDQMACHQVMEKIEAQMQGYRDVEGGLVSKSFPLYQNDRTIGSLRIQYYGPYFLDQGDFAFLGALNKIFIFIACFVSVLALVISVPLARNLSLPLRRAAEVTKAISQGDYEARLQQPMWIREGEELMHSVNALGSSLGKQEALRRQMTADIAHELRTPLTTLQTHMEAMALGLWEPTAERLSSCHEEVLRMGELIHDLSNLENLENNQLALVFSQVDIMQLWHKVIAAVEFSSQRQQVEISLEGESFSIWADESRLIQVMRNLLTNAIAYNKPQGQIQITVGKDEEWAFFSVKDQGIGISEEEQTLVFERFYRADKSRSRSTGGRGIGLAIVKAIVDAHEGKITLVSCPGEGSNFSVFLPLHRDNKS